MLKWLKRLLTPPPPPPKPPERPVLPPEIVEIMRRTDEAYAREFGKQAQPASSDGGKSSAAGGKVDKEIEAILKEFEGDIVLSTSENNFDGGESMIRAEIVEARGEKWIKLSFGYSKQIIQRMKFIGSRVDNRRLDMFCNKKAKPMYWGIKAKYIDLVIDALSDFLLKWEGEDADTVPQGGIDYKKLPATPVVDFSFKTAPLKDYQVQGFNALVQIDRLLLADEAGLGKSWQALQAIAYRYSIGAVKSVLFITKASLTYNFRDEVYMHTNLKPLVLDGNQSRRDKLLTLYRDCPDEHQIMIVSYETYRNDIELLYDLNKYRPFDMVVLDEGHKVKNPDSQIGEFIHVFQPKYRVVMTASPVINNPLEVYNIYKWLGYISWDWWTFRAYYGVFGGFNNKEIVGYKNLSKLYAIRDTMMLRRTKGLLGLPKVSFAKVKVPMTPHQRKLYNSILDESWEYLSENAAVNTDTMSNPAVAATRLQQVAGASALIEDKEALDPKSKKISGKLNALDDLLEDYIVNQKQKVIVFSRFKEMVKIMEQRYAKYNPAVVSGDVSSTGKTEEQALRQLKKEGVDVDNLSDEELTKLLQERTSSPRMREVYKYQTDETCKLFIGVAPACREGLNLVKAAHVIFIDIEFAWDYIYQAYSRAHRNGVKHPVHVTFLLSEGTVDEGILQDVEEKRDMSEVMMASRTRSKDFLAKITGYRKAG